MNYSELALHACIYLAAAVITVPFSKRMGFGSVLGYLCAGIIIGPYVLGLTGSHTSAVMEFSEFGVVMMLFLIGLELRPAMLWQLRVPLFFTGGLQVVLTTLIIMLIAHALGLSLATAFAAGMIFSASSTAIVLQLLNEKGWSKSDAGQTAFSVLLFQDIAVIPMLALFPLLASVPSLTDDHHLAPWQQALLVASVISAIILGGRFLIRPLFRYIAAARLREAFTAVSLLLVIGVALLMHSIGLSAALGTFLAGVVLAESEYRHELEADIEPFKGLLLGLFFISVGATINFALIAAHLLLVLSLVFGLMLLKCSIMLSLGKLFHKPLRENLLTAMALAQGGEFCFVLLSYASEQQILPQELTNELVAVVALSMLLTPLALLAYEKWLEPRFVTTQAQQESDIVAENNPIVIAGFGRYGQVVSRFLMVNGIQTTVLDLDAGQLEVLRKIGYKAFYGDAERLDLLHTAGLKQAKIFILAIDDSEKALKIAQTVRQHYPDLKILIRVRGRVQAYEGLQQGFAHVYRETFESAVQMAMDALVELGSPPEQVVRAGTLFKKLDEAGIRKLAPLYGKAKDFIDHAKQNRQYLDDVFAADRNNMEQHIDRDWDYDKGQIHHKDR